ncbi:lysylphosphatidylglycerol synthase domain-containing protein [Foetidibacter luteolus]|uniref:lysylphosphatidylglycerol synthase domain-containing protein n=1 Tax=Foetidibacter luteolus TaxID=2608880 RepID=UPI00129BD2C3|nr:lysylphosphatidylglycerol synthase domain-containing protein [Foetidibacter luteolus]
MQLSRKQKIILNYIVGPLLFIGLSFSIYQKVRSHPDLGNSLQLLRDSYTGLHGRYLFLVIMLSIVNWGIEARKWQVLVRGVQPVSFFTSFKAVLSGLSVSLLTPNRVGEYVGRIVYMKEGNRLRSIALTIVGSMSQMIITLVLGIAGMFYVRYNILSDTTHLQGLSSLWLNGLIYLIMFGTALHIICYYKLSWIATIMEKIPFIQRYIYLFDKVEDFHWKELTRILTLSFSRYVVFTVQYLLMFKVFDVDVTPIDGSSMVCVMFLVLAILPTIPMAELGVRGQVSTQLFGLLSPNTIGILYTAAGIWFINLIIPALAGTLFILTIKLFRNK